MRALPEKPTSRLLVLGLLTYLGAVLQGCGGGGGGGPTSTTTTTTGTVKPRTPPLTTTEAAIKLNAQYMDFNILNDTTQLGVTISWAAQPTDFNANLFCSDYMNTECYKGFSDCRMSCSLFNWQMINWNYIVGVGAMFNRANGYVFNQDMVEKKIGKCSFLFDGASENRLNNGCAGPDGSATCEKDGKPDPTSGFADQCPHPPQPGQPTHNCTADDPEVKGALCKPYGTVDVPVHPIDFGCIYSGPSLNYPKMDQPDHLRMMVKKRVNNSIKTLSWKEHNEVILDERLLIQALFEDPAVVVEAFVYALSQGAQARAKAEAMSKSFSKQWQCGKVPVIAVNDIYDFRTNSPWGKSAFLVPNASYEIEVLGSESAERTHLSQKDGEVELSSLYETDGEAKWVIEKGGGDWYHIKHLFHPSYLSATGDGSQVVLQEEESALHLQKWSIVKGNGDWYNIKTADKVSGRTLHLSVAHDTGAIRLDSEEDGRDLTRWSIPGFAEVADGAPAGAGNEIIA